MDVYKLIKDCGHDYKNTVDLLVKSNEICRWYSMNTNSSYDVILRATIRYNHQAFKYFFENYLQCYRCKGEYEKEILDLLSFDLTHNLLDYICSKGIYPEQILHGRASSCICVHQEPCHLTENCTCIYHCSGTSFYQAMRGDCQYDFVRIGLKYIDPKVDSVLFKNGVINRVLLCRYIKTIKESDDKDYDYRTMKLLYEFYKKHCDKDITYDNFINLEFDTCESKILERIEKLEDDIAETRRPKSTVPLKVCSIASMAKLV